MRRAPPLPVPIRRRGCGQPAGLSAALGTADPTGAPDAAGLRTAFVVAGGIGTVALLASSFVRRRPSPATETVGTAHGGTDDRTDDGSGDRPGHASTGAGADAPVRAGTSW